MLKSFFILLIACSAVSMRANASANEWTVPDIRWNQAPPQEKRVNRALLTSGILLIGAGGAFLLAGYNDDGHFGKPDPSLTGLGWALAGSGLLCIVISFPIK